MDELDLIGDIPKIDIPGNIEFPISHDVPKTTLESLLQIKNEFSSKLEDAKAKNDSSKKRRYERQLKQFEDAIKATKEGKTFNYAELIVPPGFAKIPLQNDGRPILNLQPSRSSSNVANRAASNVSESSRPRQIKETYDNINENDEASDDLIAQLEGEIDSDNLEDEDEANDPEVDRINRQINSLMPNIKQMIPKDVKIEDDLEAKIASLKISPGNSQRQSLQPQAGAINKQSKAPAISPPKVQQPAVVQRPQQPQQQTSPTKRQAQSRELAILLERQRLFKEAALKAKTDGNVKVALVYLRHAKGFDSMIFAAENGLPLDMNNLPIPPQMESLKSTHQVSNIKHLSSESTPVKIDEIITGDRESIYKRLLEDLREQVSIATANFKHFTNMGDVANANKFNQIARETIKDLDGLKSAYAHGGPVPLYHYERRSYQTIDCNSDLTDNDLELTIIRAINLPLPKDFDAKHLTTYVKFEFPYPPEGVQTDKTAKQSGTLNPEYNQVFKLQIHRKLPKFVRLMNRKELKLEIFYRAGLLKGDKLLAACSVKLQALEKSSTVHDAFDLLEGRKQIGGKLELKIRIREPLLHKEVKSLEQKWLIIDSYDVVKKNVSSF